MDSMLNTYFHVLLSILTASKANIATTIRVTKEKKTIYLMLAQPKRPYHKH